MIGKVCARDLFHDELAGKFQSVIRTTYRIVDAFANNVVNSTTTDSLAILDLRTSSTLVPEPTSNPELCHLHHRTYKEGLISLLYSGKDSSNTGGASGSGGNMRSSLSLGQLFQTILAIGPFGSIVPNVDCTVELKKSKYDAKDKHLTADITNPTEILVNCAFGSISFYCEMLRKQWTKRYFNII